MGDHRAEIKIEMEFHGIKDKTDMSINYFPSDCCNMDSRVKDFFDSIYERGIEKYNKEMRKYWEEHNKKQIEEEEKKELKRLKEKYENSPSRA